MVNNASKRKQNEKTLFDIMPCSEYMLWLLYKWQILSFREMRIWVLADGICEKIWLYRAL